MYFADFETKCREKALHCDFPITIDNPIIMLTVVKTSNDFRSQIFRKNGDLKLVRETAKSLLVAKKGSQTIKGGDMVHSQAKDDPEVKQASRPGRCSMRCKGPGQTTGRPQAKARPACTKCGNEAHINRNACSATGRRSLKCGCLKHFAGMCNKASNEGKEQQAKSVELAQDTNTHYVF